MPRLNFRSKNRRFARIVFLATLFLAFFPRLAQADTYNVTGNQDFFFYWSEARQYTFRTYAQQFGIDSMLWLYNNDTGELVAQNDDYYGLDSYIQFNGQAGVTYRLRTGVCCGNPNYWYGTSYQLEASSTASNISNGGTTTTSSTSTTTTTIPRSLGRPTNVTLTDTGLGIRVDWDAAQDNINASPERYAISWSTGNAGWGIATGNVGDENALVTEQFIPYSTFESTGGLSAEYIVTVRADNDTLGVYSQQSVGVSLQIGVMPPPPTTTTTSTTTTTTSTTTTTVPVTTTQTIPVETSTTVAPTTTVAQTTTTSTVPVVTTTTSTTLAPTTTLRVPETTTTTTIVPSTTTIPTTTTVVPTTTTTTPIPVAPVASLTATEIQNVIQSSAFAELPKEELENFFESLEDSELTEEQAEAVATAMSEAPDEVKQTFESTVNVFGGKFDTYVPSGSKINVGQRKAVIAATGILFVAPTVSTTTTSGSTSSSRKR